MVLFCPYRILLLYQLFTYLRWPQCPRLLLTDPISSGSFLSLQNTSVIPVVYPPAVASECPILLLTDPISSGSFLSLQNTSVIPAVYIPAIASECPILLLTDPISSGSFLSFRIFLLYQLFTYLRWPQSVLYYS